MREQIEKQLRKAEAKLAVLDLAHQTRTAPIDREISKLYDLLATLDKHEKEAGESTPKNESIEP